MHKKNRQHLPEGKINLFTKEPIGLGCDYPALLGINNRKISCNYFQSLSFSGLPYGPLSLSGLLCGAFSFTPQAMSYVC